MYHLVVTTTYRTRTTQLVAGSLVLSLPPKLYVHHLHIITKMDFPQVSLPPHPPPPSLSPSLPLPLPPSPPVMHSTSMLIQNFPVMDIMPSWSHQTCYCCCLLLSQAGNPGWVQWGPAGVCMCQPETRPLPVYHIASGVSYKATFC